MRASTALLSTAIVLAACDPADQPDRTVGAAPELRGEEPDVLGESPDMLSPDEFRERLKSPEMTPEQFSERLSHLDAPEVGKDQHFCCDKLGDNSGTGCTAIPKEWIQQCAKVLYCAGSYTNDEGAVKCN